MDLPTNTQDPHDLRLFWRRVPLQDTAAGTTSARSRTPSSHRGERSRKANSQPNSCEGTIDSCTQLHNFLMNVFSPIPGSSLLPTPGHLPLCLNNWLQITSDQWVIQAARGYKLELISAPHQEIPTKDSGSQGPPLHGPRDSEAHEQGCSEEGHLCANQFLSQIFLGPPRKMAQQGW